MVPRELTGKRAIVAIVGAVVGRGESQPESGRGEPDFIVNII
jgi:hypothetical protein